MKKTIIILATLMIFPAGHVLSDFESEMLAAASLSKEGKHNEAIQSWINLADACNDPAQQYEAICRAAECARMHSGGEERALEICNYLAADPYNKACRAYVFQWTGNSSNVLAEFESVDFTAWPEDLAALGYKVRGNAHFNLKKGQEAARDFLKAFQCSKSYDKWTAMRMLGQTYWKLLDDPLIAEACFRKCVSDFGGGHPGLQARIDLADLLMQQKRYEDALRCLQSPADRPESGYWLGAILFAEAKVYAEMDRKSEAIKALEMALKTHGINQYQQKNCENMLTELKHTPAQQPAPPAK